MNAMYDNVYSEDIRNCPVSGQSAIFTEARRCLQNHSVGRQGFAGRFASDPASSCYRNGLTVLTLDAVIPTRLERLTALRAAITAANYRAITPDCCGRPAQELSRACGGEGGDSFDFECVICGRATCVDLPGRLAQAHSVGGGAR